MLTHLPMYASEVELSAEEANLYQIMEIYQSGYISLATAKDLANRHGGDAAAHMVWPHSRPVRRIVEPEETDTF